MGSTAHRRCSSRLRAARLHFTPEGWIVNHRMNGAVELAYFMEGQDAEGLEILPDPPENRKDLLCRPKSHPPTKQLAAAVVDELLAQLSRGG